MTIQSCLSMSLLIAMITGILPNDVSEQHLLDCAWPTAEQKENVCRSAWADRYHKWMYITNKGGIANENEYPYAIGHFGTSQAGPNQCDPSVKNANHGAVVTSHQRTWSSTEDDIMRLLAAGHSVTTSLFVTGNFHIYKRDSGIYQEPKCTNLREPGHQWQNNHAVAIVGYGEEAGVKYWKFKNSWGTGWGDNGFGKILRGVGHCGIAMEFSVPICSALPCNIEAGVYISRGNNVKIIATSGQSECAYACATTTGCVAWTLRLSDNNCWLKSDDSPKGWMKGWITGTKACGGNTGKWTTACEWENPPNGGSSMVSGHVNIDCQNTGTGKIKISYALWGRLQQKICIPSWVDSKNFDFTCLAETALAKVKELCEGKGSCSVKASNGNFGDPCYGTWKYLTVVHSCEG